MASIEDRGKLLKAAKGNEDLQIKLIAQCKYDILFWFDYFAYTFNPRVRPSDLPFNLMHFQRQVVLEIQKCIDNSEPLLIEKSRDMGITWMIALVFHWYWLFFDGSHFLIGSKVQDLVDKKGDRSTIFEKLRYNHRMQPGWMTPPLTKGYDNFMRLIHPQSGNTIVGASSTPDFGRSGRYKAALMDEMAFHPYGKAAYESVSQSTDCIIMPSTPNGKLNEFYKLRSLKDMEWIDIEGDPAPLDAA